MHTQTTTRTPSSEGTLPKRDPPLFYSSPLASLLSLLSRPPSSSLPLPLLSLDVATAVAAAFFRGGDFSCCLGAAAPVREFLVPAAERIFCNSRSPKAPSPPASQLLKRLSISSLGTSKPSSGIARWNSARVTSPSPS